MSPRQKVVVENKALKRFVRKYGYCIRAGKLAGAVEEAIGESGTEDGSLYLPEEKVVATIKRRNDQWFVTNIELEER